MLRYDWNGAVDEACAVIASHTSIRLLVLYLKNDCSVLESTEEILAMSAENCTPTC